MTLTLDDLASPADADMFRMTVDWGRWYIDPLPTCEIAEATEDQWPSCSFVKKAADKDWSFLTVNRMAGLDPAELHRIAGLDHTQRGDAIRSHEKLAKNTAFGRGSIVHLWGEDLGRGLGPREITDQWLAANGYPVAARVEAERYKAAMIDFFNTYQPELVAAEYVTIHRTLNEKGYGATPDGLFRIDGGLYGIDWKTRGESSSHAAYPEEAAQIACGALAEYMIVRVGDHAERRPIPPVDGGYVVSIRPDGARLYPVDIPQAFDYWTHLHEWWTHTLDAKKSIGRVKAKRSSPAGPGNREAPRPSSSNSSDEPANPAGEEPSRRQQLLARYKSFNDDEQRAYLALGIPKDATDDEVQAGLEQVDKFNVVVRMPLEPEFQLEDPPTPPDEGGTVSAADVAALEARFKQLPLDGSLWTGRLVAEGNRAFPFRIKDRPSVRRFEIYRGILLLAEHFYGGGGAKAISLHQPWASVCVTRQPKGETP